MNILGLSGAVGHDASAALLVDGVVVAAAEEERFIRDKHAKGRQPLEAARYCLREVGLKPSEVHLVAYPFAPVPITSPARWHYARRTWYAPDRALTALFAGNRRYHRNRRRVGAMLAELGCDPALPFLPVEHHLAHASSAYHLSGFDGPVAILSVDGRGEYASTLLAVGEGGRIEKRAEFYEPDSLGGLYGALTEYLGFEMLDGEFKVMGMAPYGDPARFDFSRLLDCSGATARVNNSLVNVVGLRRYKEGSKGYFFSPKLHDWLGPRRVGDAIDEPYIHYAAAVQALLEDAVLKLVQHHLRPTLEAGGGRLVYAGGVALNVKLNQRLLALPYVNELFVQPAAGDAGTALGAASFAAVQAGETVAPLRHVYLGPAFDTAACIQACQAHSGRPRVRRVSDPVPVAAALLTDGHPLAWFQGRMEFGPRALGNRSILGDPAYPGIAERINAQIKYRERWRPFCPSVLARDAPAMIGTDHPAPYMTLTFDVTPAWRARAPEVVHQDGTARVQVVDAQANPRYHALLQAMAEATGSGVLLNTSMNRRGEPMVCSPTDALDMFFGCDLEYLMLEDLLVTKR